jgi:large subunit ribosomal protein L15
MKLNELPKITKKSAKRLGRGYGSGKGGHTTNRGNKGLKARNKVPLLFEGTKMRKSLIRRLPFLRGKGKFKSQRPKPFIINVSALNRFEDGTEITVEVLQEAGMVDQEVKGRGVKILGNGTLKKKLIVKLPVSQGAQKKIEKAGGEIKE